MASARLKGSFIYLANAVHDMTGNWTIIGFALAPLVIMASLCLLPDALNLQHQLLHTFESGTHSVSVGWHTVQAPYNPSAAEPVAPLFPAWEIRVLELLFAFITFVANLLVLCTLERVQKGLREATPLNEVLAIYRRAIHLLPSFLWVAALQLLATVVGFVLLIVPGFLAFIWLYFAQYALVLDNQRGWAALLHSRELMRGRFFKVAIRVVVFLAVWSGFNSWSSAVFVGGGFVLGFFAITSGVFWAAIVLIFDVMWMCVTYGTTAFFYAAGVRLYQDLNAVMGEQPATVVDAPLPATAPLSQQMQA
ncbi:MAG TPA: hypothetical protein VMB26_10000 [Candidatus Binataceae bacterium]|nr:hypothetical protein [Candidatus Binataceae bacterium]